MNYLSDDPDEPYFVDESQWGRCPECDSGLVNVGMMSDGDGDLYDSLQCPLCQEERGRANEVWVDANGNLFEDEGDWVIYGNFEEPPVDPDDTQELPRP